MKKFLIVIFFALITPNISNACESMLSFKNSCSIKEIDNLLKKYRTGGTFNKYTLPSGMTRAEAIKILRSAKKKRKAEKKERCTYISGNANNSWSAYRMYKECMKK